MTLRCALSGNLQWVLSALKKEKVTFTKSVQAWETRQTLMNPRRYAAVTAVPWPKEVCGRDDPRYKRHPFTRLFQKNEPTSNVSGPDYKSQD